MTRAGVGSTRRSPTPELGADGLFAYAKVKSLYTALDTDIDSRSYGAVGVEWD